MDFSQLARRTCIALMFTWAAMAGAATPAESATKFVTDTAHALEGRLSYYAQRLAGRLTASGERFDPEALTMAHMTLPLGTLVRVTNLVNQRSVVVRVNDRGGWDTKSRVGDVSNAAARALGFVRQGIARVQLEVLQVTGDKR